MQSVNTNYNYDMEIGFFAFNSSSGISMVKKSKSEWIANYNNSLWLLENLEKAYSFDYFLLPISRWIGSGKSNVTGDAIESISLASSLLAKSTRTKIFSTLHTFSHLPETTAHSAVFLNETFNKRYGINLVCGWKEDEINYFHVNDWKYDERYLVAKNWVERFRIAEKTYAEIRDQKVFTQIVNAAFSKEGRDFAKNNVDNLFTTIPSKFDVEMADPKLKNSYVSATFFYSEKIDEARKKYEKLLKYADKAAALDFAMAIKKSDKIKGNMYLSNQPMVVTGSGLPSLILDEKKLISLITYLHNSGCKGLAINLNNFFDAINIVNTIEKNF